MKIKKILKRLLQLHPKSVDLSLNRIKRLLKDLDNPEQKLKNVIQVLGTNGKYSFCTTLREIFETAGYTVNLNISPSIKKFNERYYFSGRHISDHKLQKLLIEVEKANKSKIYLSRHKRLFVKAGSGKIRPLLRPISAFWPKTGRFKPIQPIWSKNAML